MKFNSYLSVADSIVVIKGISKIDIQNENI